MAGAVRSQNGALPVASRHPTANSFWSRHVNFTAQPLARPLGLLGAERATDLAMNAILPWLHARAGSDRERAIVAGAFHRWPASGDNSVLKLARRRLLGGTATIRFRHAAEQQGLLQIVRDYCDRSNAACDGCRFPELVGQVSRAGLQFPSA